MKATKNNLIEIPIEFKVACTIDKVDIQEVLQIFIDHVTIYDSISTEYSKGFSEATRTISACLLDKERPVKRSKAVKECRDLTIQCIKGIVALAKKKTGKAHIKRKKSLFYVNAIFNMMERLYAPADVLYLDELTTLHLSKDFCVICELHSFTPKEYLEYFMSRISLADLHARKAMKLPEHNLTMDFFKKIVDCFASKSPQVVNLTDLEIDFYQRMEELRLELYNIRSLSERIAFLKDFYLSHYLKMTS